MAAKPRYYVDSSVYIAIVTNEKGRVDPSRELLERAERGDFQVVGSELVRVELARNVKGSTSKVRKRALEAVRDFLAMPQFLWVSTDRRVGDLASTLSNPGTLRVLDAVHAASSVVARCDALFSWDGDFAECTQLTEQMRVMRPDEMPGQMALQLAPKAHLAAVPAPTNG